MNSTYVVFPLFVGLALFYTVWMKRKAASALTQSLPAFTAFFERTGYRYFDIATLPPEAQTQRAMADANQMTGNRELHYVRNFHGLPIHYLSSSGTEKRPGGKTVFYMSNSWQADLPAPPRIPLHIADKKLVSTMKAVGEMFSNTKRIFKPACSQTIQTGIADVDNRFVVYGEDVNAVRWLFQQNPALLQLLSGWAELDIAVIGRQAVFADPSQNNMQAAMGGMVGNMAMGFDYAKRIELGIPVHDRVAELLATLARAAA